MTGDGRVRLTVIYPVKDFEQFASVIGAPPQSEGVVSRRVYRSVDDPSEVLVEIEVASYDLARQMIRGQSVRDILDRAGAEIYPPVFIGAEVDHLRFDATQG
jgi:hypothetical protein